MLQLARARARVYTRAKQYTRWVCRGWLAGFGKPRTRLREGVSGAGVDGNSDVLQCWKERGREGGKGGSLMAVIELLIKPVN